ncbi:MAG: ATP-binding protein [Actinomycetota bacterium]|nr:ATP-binding protein [Actinomycetota bacterium]
MPDFNPLEAVSTAAAGAAVKQRVRNVIKSYHSATDVLAEPVQNAVDEVSNNPNRAEGSVTVRLSVDLNELEVIDDGRGITIEDAKRFLAPDVTDKPADWREGRVRGHKGVGLTFLAYGFNFFELESRMADGTHYRVRLEDGRRWVDDPTKGLADAPLAELTMNPEEPRVTDTGTSIRIRLSPGTTPGSISHSFNSAKYAAAVLETQTAIGVVPPERVPPVAPFSARLEYVPRTGAPATLPLTPRYRFPHERLPSGTRVMDLGAYMNEHPNEVEPPPTRRQRYHAVYTTLDAEEVISALGEGEPEFLTSRDELIAAIREHDVHVYGLYSYSAEYRESLGSAWGVPGNKQLHYPGFRIATDGMISSWYRETALTHRGFYVDRVWMLYHFKQVEPDLGRKDFPAEVLEVVRFTEEAVANDLIRKGQPFLRPTPRGRRPSPDTFVEPAVKATQRLEEPLTPASLDGFGEIAFGGTPKEEQDVVALFNQLIGMGVLPNYKPVYLSGVDDYDGFFHYRPGHTPDPVQDRMPGEMQLDDRDKRGIVEFKLHGSELLDNIVSGVKRWEEMDLLVCWEVGQTSRTLAGDRIDFIEAESPIERRYAGVTHLATTQSGGQRELRVLALRPFLEKMSS